MKDEGNKEYDDGRYGEWENSLNEINFKKP